MNGETTRAYGERLADQMAYLNRLVQETSGHQRGIGCYVARHNRRHPDRPVSHNKDFELSRAASMRGGRRATPTDAARWSLRTPLRCMRRCPSR
jgi:hypothetical protein